MARSRPRFLSTVPPRGWTAKNGTVQATPQSGNVTQLPSWNLGSRSGDTVELTRDRIPVQKSDGPSSGLRPKKFGEHMCRLQSDTIH